MYGEGAADCETRAKTEPRLKMYPVHAAVFSAEPAALQLRLVNTLDFSSVRHDAFMSRVQRKVGLILYEWKKET